MARVASKFHNVRTEVDGLTFDSKREARRWGELRILERAGKISGLARQIPYALTVNGQKVCTYRSDFEYVENGQLVVEDSKGHRTPEYRLKKKLMQAVHGISIRET